MRDPNRIEKVLEAVGAIWKKYPDLRLMQLLLNCDFSYNTEDDVVVKKIEIFYRRGDKNEIQKV